MGGNAHVIVNASQWLAATPDVRIDPDAFDGRASWDADLARIDMELFARKSHAAPIGGVRSDLAEGAPIHVSTSRKYTRATLADLAEVGKWRLDTQHMDAKSPFSAAVLGPCHV